MILLLLRMYPEQLLKIHWWGILIENQSSLKYLPVPRKFRVTVSRILALTDFLITLSS